VRKPRALNELLLIHELTFVLLLVLAVAAGAFGIRQWQQASQESQRINSLIQEIQETRGDLYRQMKELFDAYFLSDPQARVEYDGYALKVRKHFQQLRRLADGREEQDAIEKLQQSYGEFLDETSSILDRYQTRPDEALKKTLNTGIETGVFSRYEAVSAHAERLLALKQNDLKHRLQAAQRTALLWLGIPVVLAILLLLFSRVFLQRAIVRPIAAILHATTELSAGRLHHKVPQAGAAELGTLAQAINQMASDLARSREALIRSEKQAAQGALVPMLAHNIRNPLASIRAVAQVADTPDAGHDARQSFNDIIDTVDRLERWTGALLAYLHPLRPQLAAVTLQQVLTGALAPLQQKIREKSMTVECPPMDPPVRLTTDQHLLEQTLYNLLQNAVDASPHHAAIRIELIPSADQIELRLLDRGVGMPFAPNPSQLSPGPSTKRFGTGLGIPFAFKVCEALGGKITFSARPGGGTLVSMELPRQPAASSAASDSTPAARS
jgi:signal transduction histidine kinase